MKRADKKKNIVIFGLEITENLTNSIVCEKLNHLQSLAT